MSLFLLSVILLGLAGCKVQPGEEGAAGIHKEYVEGEILIKFKAGVSMEEIGRVNKTLGTEIIKVLSDRLYLLRLPKDSTVLEMIERYMEKPEVEHAEPNYRVRIQ